MATQQQPVKAGIPWHVATLAALPVLQMTASNADRIEVHEALFAFGVLLAIAVAMLVLLRLAFRRPDITDILTTLLLGMVILPVTLLMPGAPKWPWVLAWLVPIYAVIRWAEVRRIVPGVLTIATGVMCVFQLYNTLASGAWFNRSPRLEVAQKAFTELPQPATTPAEKPDIFYLIFDRYHRADYLKKIYGHDNAAFIDELRKRGFYVADESYSNYQRTAHSVVSSLNFDYLDTLSTPETKNSNDWLLLYEMFQNFRMGRFLKNMGYEIHFAGSWWEATRRVAIADVHHNHYEQRELMRVLYEGSLLLDAARALGIRQGDPLYWQCQRSKLMFEDLRQLQPGPAPQFYFAHFLLPHPPFVVHEDGHCMTIAEARARTREQNYAGQVKFANGEILKTIDALLARPGPKPVIIVQSDEGPWPKQFAGDEITSFAGDVASPDWASVPVETLREKMAILNAVYAPALPATDLTPDMSPVNTFRKVLRTYFNVPIVNLPDRHKIYLDTQHLYEFKDVTDELRAK